jgi:hypothetical protein
MRLPDDDEIYDVDQTYLGPPGKYIGRYRYRALMVGPLVFLLGLAMLARTGIGFSLLSVGLLFLVVARLTTWVVDHTNQERPIPVLVATFRHELTARRAPHRGDRSKATRAFKTRTTQIGDAHPLPQSRRRWRSYANHAASKGE